MHNYIRHEADPIDAKQHEDYLEEAPTYTKGQLPELRDFIKKSIRRGAQKDVLSGGSVCFIILVKTKLKKLFM